MARGARLAFLALVVTFMVFVPRGAHACSCAPGIPVCESFSRTSAVFTAEVLEIKDEPSANPRPGQRPAHRRVTLRVEQTFRGTPATRTEVYTGSDHANCGYPFKRGEKYLVFASELEGRLTVSVCSPTRPLAVASKELDTITKSCAGQPAQLAVTGSVVRPNSRAVAKVNVTLLSADPAREVVATAVSDRRGAFSISAPAGRRYLVVGSIGDERAEVGPFELTSATAPILLVLRK